MAGSKTPQPPRPAERARGRWLADFGALSAAEVQLVDACTKGDWCRLGGQRPIQATPECVVRAALIRFLALGGDSLHPVHEAGVQLQGSWISGGLRLSACDVALRLSLLDCMLDEALHGFDARLRSLNLSGSRCASLRVDRAEIAGGLTLNRGFVVDSPLSLVGARIGGDLDCRGACFVGAESLAFDASYSAVAGQILLCDSFTAGGQMRLIGAQVGGDLVLSGGRFTQQGVAFAADGIQVEGNILLGAGAHVIGEFRIPGARIGGHLAFQEARLENGDGNAIHAENAAIGQALILRDTVIQGRVVLTDAQIATLADDLVSWPVGQIALDGLRYQRISSPVMSAEARIAWLESQVPDDVGRTFRPQPWEQLIRVLREMGHAREATVVAIAKQRAMRRAGRIGNRLPPALFDPLWHKADAVLAIRRGVAQASTAAGNFWARLIHGAYGLFAGYGHRPERIGMWIVMVWLVGGLYFSAAGRSGIMAPSEPTIIVANLDGAKRATAARGPGSCGVRNEVTPDNYWARCPGLPSEYPHFDGWLFTADLVLPVVDFRQFAFWAPAVTYADASGTVRPLEGGMLSKTIEWLIVLFGWAMSLLFGAIVTRVVEKD
ncbi:hypothetical protein [Sphingomonas sp. M1-B02]|uniref:hypothetical protein n=1 Tax=Sphingomonas sp. M1-B02 TaxID=3114300 RepID=UPI00223FA057|nr:hypothetical protein [Sphingomonas sp. S6-11]UZK67836.1 hypothetical protein OKW87_08455 [Sphingomonas sp. S6-11]